MGGAVSTAVEGIRIYFKRCQGLIRGVGEKHVAV